MRSFANFLVFQAGWFACVESASRGHVWLGPAVVVLLVVLHLRFVSRPRERRRELRFIAAAGLVGLVLDTGLAALGATHYPGTEAAWPWTLAPPWITALWVLFATLPHHSLGWLAGKPSLAVLLGAIGGPLSYFAGVRMGAVGVAEQPLLTWCALSLEYALVTPALLAFARPPR